MGTFIVLEAQDAGGSQTQTAKLADRLRQEEYDVLQLHFPQEDRATGQLIYEKFLHAHNRKPFSKREQALLYLQDFFSRAEDIGQHLQRKRSVVVSDRFYSSTMAYQSAGLTGAARERMVSWIRWLAETGSPRLPQPAVVVYLNTPVKIIMRHLSSRRKDYHEKRSKLMAFERSYNRLAKEENWTIINSANAAGQQRSIEDIHEEIWQNVEQAL